MRLCVIGTGEHLDGVILTYDEFREHPAYRPMLDFRNMLLFVNRQDGVHAAGVWEPVMSFQSSNYAVVRATPEERQRLWDSCYRMVNLADREPAAIGGFFRDQRDVSCLKCGKTMAQTDYFFGRRMWHRLAFTCRHESPVLCPDCYVAVRGVGVACTQCGCEETYC